MEAHQRPSCWRRECSRRLPPQRLWRRKAPISAGGSSPRGAARHAGNLGGAGPNNRPSPIHSGGEITTDQADSGGIVGVTDSAALVDLWTPGGPAGSTVAGHQTIEVPLDGSPTIEVDGLLLGVVDLEAQGAIVDQWFGGKGKQAGNPMDRSSPYFGYIANNILLGAP